jgi:hypothetical protein
MVPDAEWNDLRAAMSPNDLMAARDHAAALLTWLDGGGFPPHVDLPDLDDEAVRFEVGRSCLAILSGPAAGG